MKIRAFEIGLIIEYSLISLNASKEMCLIKIQSPSIASKMRSLMLSDNIRDVIGESSKN